MLDFALRSSVNMGVAFDPARDDLEAWLRESQRIGLLPDDMTFRVEGGVIRLDGVQVIPLSSGFGTGMPRWRMLGADGKDDGGRRDDWDIPGRPNPGFWTRAELVDLAPALLAAWIVSWWMPLQLFKRIGWRWVLTAAGIRLPAALMLYALLRGASVSGDQLLWVTLLFLMLAWTIGEFVAALLRTPAVLIAHERRLSGCCVRCGYPRRGAAAPRCSECGLEISDV